MRKITYVKSCEIIKNCIFINLHIKYFVKNKLKNFINKCRNNLKLKIINKEADLFKIKKEHEDLKYKINEQRKTIDDLNIKLKSNSSSSTSNKSDSTNQSNDGDDKIKMKKI